MKMYSEPCPCKKCLQQNRKRVLPIDVKAFELDGRVDRWKRLHTRKRNTDVNRELEGASRRRSGSATRLSVIETQCWLPES